MPDSSQPPRDGAKLKATALKSESSGIGLEARDATGPVEIGDPVLLRAG